ncbi:MAG TPA: FAD-dependent monooxygenase, partial [Ktedonobacteraceae bacterium]|nr:FAD-dependent monooxygenase [Ktedonobacteraceae bacterium]
MTTPQTASIYDVVICGAGLAGLTLARQLARELPHLSLLVIEGTKDKAYPTSLNVGESTIEISTHYLADILGLRSYLETTHLRKVGLRFFFASDSQALNTRPEFGLSHPPAIASFQLDRAIFEADLKAQNTQMGIPLINKGVVKEVHLASENELHEILFEDETSQIGYVRCRWVIDAMGRRRFLQRKLGLAMPQDKGYSAAWFRLPGRIDVEHLVPASIQTWHARVPEQQRYFSTNHLMGNGRWVWLIPLSSGRTSVGIVAQEELFPFQEYNTYQKALCWLQREEPELRALIGSLQPLDFQCLRHYTYSAKQVFSTQRWACTGDAAVFADPFLSPGIDQLGFANTLITEMISLESRQQLTVEKVEMFNRAFLGFNDTTSWLIHNGYPFLGNATVMAAKLIWDFARGFSINGPQRFNKIYLSEQKAQAIQPYLAKVFSFTAKMERLFKEWSLLSKKRPRFHFLDYFTVPGMQDLYLRNLRSCQTPEELVTSHKASVEYLEELAQLIFLVALADTMPEIIPRLPDPLWLNTRGIGLDPSRWESERLFSPP